MTQETRNQEILERLTKLYRDLPLEYAGYALTAIHDIEAMMYKKAYNERWDAYYDPYTREWQESQCDDPTCEFCANRPPKAP